MKKLITTFLVLFLCIVADAQYQAQIDSLILVSDTLSDDLDKAKNYRRLHELIMFTDPDLAREYAMKALNIATEKKDIRGIAAGYLQIGNYFVNRNENDSSTYYYHIALEKFKRYTIILLMILFLSNTKNLLEIT